MTKLRDAKKKAKRKEGNFMSEYSPPSKAHSNQSKAVARYHYGPMLIENDYLGKGKGK